MTCLSKRKFFVCMVTFSICLALLVPQAFSLSLEEIISRRMSTRSYTSGNISRQQLLELLQMAYGYNNGHRSIPQIGDDYSLVIFPYNETGCYRYVPESNSLVVHDPSVNKNNVPAYDYFGQVYVSTASVVLAVVWNQTKMDNGIFASAEAGCFVQNMYLAAVSNDIGTCCVGSIHSEDLREDLNLPSTLIPLLVMPLGYPENPYPPASPNYDHMTGNLPPVQYSSLSFEDAVRNIVFAQEWGARDLSLQELSQLLWAAYGYTNLTNWGSDRLYHKTTPGIHYELIIYVSNATGIYKYLSEVLPDHTPRHSITEIVHGDKRNDIANACAGQVWAADAPAIFLIAFNSSYNDGNTGDTMGQAIPHCFMEVSAGAVIQDLFLEASAWNMSANVVNESPEGWNGTGAQELRSILGLPPAVIPLHIVPVGVRVPVHDVAITSITLSPTTVLPGQAININVTVQNQGGFSESFEVTAYYDSIAIETQPVSLDIGASTILTFVWNTTGVDKGEYAISAEASVVPSETDLTDNTKVADAMVTVLSSGHDVAIMDVTPSKTIVGQGYSLSISVTAKSYGNFTETFNVTAYYNATNSIATQTISLTSGNSTTITFTWNTTGVPKDNYTISATANQLPGETDTTDNNYADGTVRVNMVGDIAPEFGIVDIVDIVTAALAFASAPEDDPETPWDETENWNPIADINDNGIVDIVDIVIVAIHFGETDR